MSAIVTGHRGGEDHTNRACGSSGCSLSGLGEGPKLHIPDFAHQHAQLTRMVWIRRHLEQVLATRKFRVVSLRSGRLAWVLDHGIGKYEIPWMPALKDFMEFEFWGETSKMRCPSFDLPSGSPYIGGSCPGATAGQSTTLPEHRMSQLEEIDGRLYIAGELPGGGRIDFAEWGKRSPTCQWCYATLGQYPTPGVQLSELVRYHWCLQMSQSASGQREWVRTMMRSLEALEYPDQAYVGPNGERSSILPLRVHSSGDFFDERYADMWLKLVNEVWRVDKRLCFWAPTRTWAARGWTRWWADNLGRLDSVKAKALPNLIVRPSAYHAEDPAPGALHPSNAKGTTAIWKDTKLPLEGRRDFDCGVYALKKSEKKTCLLAHGVNSLGNVANGKSLNGKAPCRVCWTHPHLSVNFTLH